MLEILKNYILLTTKFSDKKYWFFENILFVKMKIWKLISYFDKSIVLW
jgi:hypothetical protein